MEGVLDASGAAPREAGRFLLHTHFAPAGDQVQAIERLVAGVEAGVAPQTLLGSTGSGKTSPWPR